MPPYRSDRDAMELRLAQLERENEELRRALAEERRRRQELLAARDAQRAQDGRRACLGCGGTLLPVAIFAGHDHEVPLPVRMSTIRFGRPRGGFTHSVPLQALACASCGLVHPFVPMADRGAGGDASGPGSGAGDDLEPIPPAEGGGG